MNKFFLSLFFFSSNFFAIIINENMGNIDNWYDSDDKFPFVVQRTKGNTGMFCTGTLINSRTVISSAHCSKNVFNEIWMGNDLSTQNTQVAVTSEISHPDYSPIGADLDEEHWRRRLLWQLFCRFEVARDFHFDKERKRVAWDATAPIPSNEGPLPVRRWPAVTLHDPEIEERVEKWMEREGL